MKPPVLIVNSFQEFETVERVLERSGYKLTDAHENTTIFLKLLGSWELEIHVYMKHWEV